MHAPLPFIIGYVHHVVRFVFRFRAFPPGPRVQREHRLDVEIWLGWVCGGRREFQDQSEVDRVLKWWLPFQSRGSSVGDEVTRGERGFGGTLEINAHMLVGPCRVVS